MCMCLIIQEHMLTYVCVRVHMGANKEEAQFHLGPFRVCGCLGYGKSCQLFSTNVNAVVVNDGCEAGDYSGQLLPPRMLHGSSITAIKHLEKDSLSLSQIKTGHKSFKKIPVEKKGDDIWGKPSTA